MDTRFLTRVVLVRSLLLCAGIGAAISLIPISGSETIARNRFESTLKQEVSLEFTVEKR